jgi:nucleoside-diphosphate-sugar epimerase
MKRVLILGGSGYIGSEIVRQFRNKCLVEATTRETLDFEDSNYFQQVKKILFDFTPDVVINTLGKIDKNASAEEVFRAIFLPTFALYDYFRKNRNLNTHIVLIGSKSTGQPRKETPVYAAMKAAELALLTTASEEFLGTEISWTIITAPRLKGGLANSGNPKSNSKENDDSDLRDIILAINEIIGI